MPGGFIRSPKDFAVSTPERAARRASSPHPRSGQRFRIEGHAAVVVGGKFYRRGMPAAELRQAVATARAA